MSWRRFSTLLRGLGPHSAVATAIIARRHGMASTEKVVVVDGGPDATVAAFSALFAGDGSGKPN